jgi:hypothetical protein
VLGAAVFALGLALQGRLARGGRAIRRRRQAARSPTWVVASLGGMVTLVRVNAFSLGILLAASIALLRRDPSRQGGPGARWVRS